MKNNIKRIFVILIIICTILPMLFVTVAYADEDDVMLNQERAGNYVASFAINFFNNWSSENHIYEDENGNPVRTQYSSNYNIPNASDSVYLLEKRSWIDFAYLNALSLSPNQVPKNYYGTSSNLYEKIDVADLEEDILKIKEQNHDASKTSSSTETTNDDGKEENVGQTIVELMNAGKIKPGDVIVTTEEDYLLYVGGTRVIYATPPDNIHPTENGALKYDYIQNYFVEVRRELEKGHEDDKDFRAKYGAKEIYRITEEFANQIPDSSVNLMFNSRGYYDKENKYEGIPKGTYKGSQQNGLIGSIIKTLVGVAKFLIQLALFLVRAVVVGWVDLIETFVQSNLLKLSGHSSKVSFVDKISGISSTSYAGERVTIESVLFNKLPLTDANFFNFEKAGGYDLIENGQPISWLYNIRKYIAMMYVIIRNISIAAMVFVLLYVGIRMAISTLAKRKAQYNKMLTSWFTGLCIIMFIHFFMYIVLYVNDVLVDVFMQQNINAATEIMGETSETLSLYDAIRTKAYSWDFYDGLIGLIMYIFMVYFLIRYILIYLKRMVSIYVLAIYGSFVGVKYALDKSTGKRSSDSFMRWMKDFMYNVLLQSIHCLIYITLMSVAAKAAFSSASGIIVCLIVCQFILKSDKIFMKIFNVKGSLLDDTSKPEELKGLLNSAMTAAKTTAIGIGIFRFGTKLLAQNEGLRPLLRYTAAFRRGDSDSEITARAESGYLNRKAALSEGLYNVLTFSPFKDRYTNQPIHILKKNAGLMERRKRLYQQIRGIKNYQIKKALYDAIKDEKGKRVERFKRTVSTVGMATLGNVAGVASIGLYAESVTTGLAAQYALRKKMKGSSNRDIKIRRRLEPDKKYRYNVYGETRIKNEKTEKDMKKLKDKEDALVKIAGLQRQLESKIDELQTIGGIDKKELHEKLQSTFTATKRTTIKSTDVKGAISDYMHERLNGKQLSDSDLEGILKELQERLNDKNSDILIDATMIQRVKDAIVNSGASTNNIEAKDYAKILTEALDQPGVVPYIAGKRVEAASSERVLDKISEKITREYENRTGLILTDEQKKDLKRRMRGLSNIENMSQDDIVDQAVLLMEGSFADEARLREATTDAISAGVPKLGDGDFKSIMKSIEGKIKSKQIDIDLTHKNQANRTELSELGEKVKQRIIDKQKARIAGDASKTAELAQLNSGHIIEEESNQDMIQMIYETLSEPGMVPVVTIKDDATASNTQKQQNRHAERLLEESSQLLKKINGINQGNAAKNKESAISYGKFVREILDNNKKEVQK